MVLPMPATTRLVPSNEASALLICLIPRFLWCCFGARGCLPGVVAAHNAATAAVQVIDKRNWTDVEEQIGSGLPQLDPAHGGLIAEFNGALAKALMHLSRPADQVIAAADVRYSALCYGVRGVTLSALRQFSDVCGAPPMHHCAATDGQGAYGALTVQNQCEHACDTSACMQAALAHEYNEDLVVIKVSALIKHERYEAAVQLASTSIKEHGRSGKLHKALQDAQAELRKSKLKDYYGVLGVEKDVDDKTLKREYRKLALVYHPDKVAEAEREGAEKKFAELTEAYEVLSDPEKREMHDRGQDVNDPNAGGGGFGGGGGGGGFGGFGQPNFNFGGQRFHFRQG